MILLHFGGSGRKFVLICDLVGLNRILLKRTSVDNALLVERKGKDLQSASSDLLISAAKSTKKTDTVMLQRNGNMKHRRLN